MELVKYYSAGGRPKPEHAPTPNISGTQWPMMGVLMGVAARSL
jgi:hypothetical protein